VLSSLKGKGVYVKPVLPLKYARYYQLNFIRSQYANKLDIVNYLGIFHFALSSVITSCIRDIVT
jgi:hypothetical protein